MSIAQRLYEGIEVGQEGAVGLITYMRTDSTRLSQDAVLAAREFIVKRWGDKYLPAKPVFYKPRQTRPGCARSDSAHGCRPHSGKRAKIPVQRAVEPLHP